MGPSKGYFSLLSAICCENNTYNVTVFVVKSNVNV